METLQHLEGRTDRDRLIFSLPNHVIKQSISTLLIGLCFSSVAFSNPQLVAEKVEVFESWVDLLMRKRNLPGISVGLIHQGELVYAKGFGFADIEESIPATPDTVYSVASVSKPFTSMAIMQLVERGIIDLDAPILQIIPELRALDTPLEETEAISLRSLLRHTSGLPTNNSYLLVPSSPVVADQAAILNGLQNQRLLFRPNQREHYSNLGYSLIGVILERSTGDEYADYMAENIFDPLGMTSSYYGRRQETNIATGYTQMQNSGRKPVGFVDIGDAIGRPAAGLKASVNDLAKFVIWNFNTRSGEDSTVLNSETLSYMQEIHWAQLGFMLPAFLQAGVNKLSNSFDIGGIGLGFFRDGKSVFHSGGFDGFSAELMLDNENEIGIVVLANSGDTPTSWGSEYSISKNLYDMIAPTLIESNAYISSEYAEYRRIYTDYNFFNYFAMPLADRVDLIDLNLPAPFSSPISLFPLDERDSFYAPNHRGVYEREFNVRFLRDSDSKVNSMQLQTVILDSPN